MEFFTSWEGKVTRLEGRPVITRYGQIIRQLDEREYAHIEAVNIRGLSAVFLFFAGANTLELISMVLLEELKHAAQISTQQPST